MTMVQIIGQVRLWLDAGVGCAHDRPPHTVRQQVGTP